MTLDSMGEIHYQLGDLYLRSIGNNSAAKQQYRLAVAADPTLQWAHLRLGYLAYWEEGNLPFAIEKIDYALSIWPGNSDLQWPYFYLGEILADAGEIDSARNAFEMALEIEPTNQTIANSLLELNK